MPSSRRPNCSPPVGPRPGTWFPSGASRPARVDVRECITTVAETVVGATAGEREEKMPRIGERFKAEFASATALRPSLASTLASELDDDHPHHRRSRLSDCSGRHPSAGRRPPDPLRGRFRADCPHGFTYRLYVSASGVSRHWLAFRGRLVRGRLWQVSARRWRSRRRWCLWRCGLSGTPRSWRSGRAPNETRHGVTPCR